METMPAFYRGREQTYIKHLILERYLERVARNILWSKQEFVFVDGFSGPWASVATEYADTSFGIALRKLRRVRHELKATSGLNRDVRCIFVEKATAAYNKLAKAVQQVTYIPAEAIHGRFEDSIEEIDRRIGSAFVLISIDPTGWNFDLRRIAPLLRHKPGEVLVNFMFDHINRFIDDKREAIQNSYSLPFGLIDWRAQLQALENSGLEREEALLELFRTRLKELGDFEYVASTRIQRSTSNRSHFHLVYGTRHVKGLVEFRKVERETAKAQQIARNSAKLDKRVDKSMMNDLFEKAPVFNEREMQYSIANGKQEAKKFVENWFIIYRSSTYEAILALCLERFAITERELKDILVEFKNMGSLKFEGMSPRKRKPDQGVKICFIEGAFPRNS